MRSAQTYTQVARISIKEIIFHLENNNMGEVSVERLAAREFPAFCKALENASTVFHVKLPLLPLTKDNAALNEVRVLKVIKALKGKQLKYLELSFNKLTDKCTIELANILEDNRTLEKLFLDHNQIGDKGFEALVKILKNIPTLQELHFNHNQISDTGMQALLDHLFNTPLNVLALDHNKIGEKGADSLYNFLKQNEQVRQISINDNPISSKTKDKLVAVMPVKDVFRVDKFAKGQLAELVTLLKSFGISNDNYDIDRALALSTALLGDSVEIDLRAVKINEILQTSEHTIECLLKVLGDPTIRRALFLSDDNPNTPAAEFITPSERPAASSSSFLSSLEIDGEETINDELAPAAAAAAAASVSDL
jgi:Leucine-rich repeat (LRR) protein